MQMCNLFSVLLTLSVFPKNESKLVLCHLAAGSFFHSYYAAQVPRAFFLGSSLQFHSHFVNP